MRFNTPLSPFFLFFFLIDLGFVCGMKGLGVLCFEEDKDWFVGHFIALPTKQSYSILATSSFFLKNFYHYFHSIFNQTN